ncbi:MAG: peptidoglycan recognition family protein [Prochlorococcaceae cyanobacterium]
MSLGPSPSPRRSLVMAALATVFVAGVSWWAHRQLRDPGPSRSLIDLLQEVETAPMAPGASQRQAPKPPPQAAWRSPLARQCDGDRALAKRLRQKLVTYRRNAITLNIHPSNYGERFRRDAYGNRLDPTPRLVVLHETVYGIGSAINTFLTRHDADEQQVSYHTLIGLDGTIVPVLDPQKRAFGAGYSGFNGAWAVTKPSIGGSVNNFALHLSLETPLDGENDAPGHSGYSQAQYDSLAVVLADWMERFPIPAEHITTHRYVDLGSERADPRSFAWSELGKRMAALGLLCR